MKTCLFVIDVQESFRYRDYFDEASLPAYLAKQNQLIEHCMANNIAIVRVFHTDDDEPFRLDSGKVVPLQGLVDFDENLCVYKRRHSALVGTALPVWLVQNGIQHIIISGIRTEQCCETTTRHASDLGYKITFALDATLTFAMQMGSHQLTAQQIKQRTQVVLQNRFADVVMTDTIMQV